MTGNLINISLQAEYGKLVRGLAVGGQAVSAFNKGLGAVHNTARQVTGAFQAMDRSVRLAGGGILASSAGIVLSMRQAGKAAAELETAMNNVRTILSDRAMAEAGISIGRVNEKILALSRSLPQSANTLAQGLYDIASSGVAAGEQMEVLETSAMAASAGLSSTEVAARAITAAMNAYGPAAGSAAEISDVLFQTVNAGVITFEEMAVNMGDWIGIASNLGVSLEDASSALATITLSGIPAAQAATNLGRTMQALIEPSDAMTDAFEQLGVATGTELIAQFGSINGALEAVYEVTGRDLSVLSELFNNVNALEGALAISAREGENFARVQDLMGERTGSTADALARQSQGFEYQSQIMMNSLRSVQIELGQRFVPFMSFAAKSVTGFASGFSDLPGPAKTAVAALMALSAVVTGLSGVILVSSLRKKLYVLALNQLPPSLKNTTIATKLTTVANDGLIRSMLRGIPVLTATIARRTAMIPGIGAGTVALNAQTQAIAANVTGWASAGKVIAAGASGLMTAGLLWMDMAGATAAAKAEAEAYVEQVKEGMDFDSYRGAIDSVNALITRYDAFNETVMESYDGVDQWGQAVLRVAPFVASSLETNAAIQGEYEEEIRNTTKAVNLYEYSIQQLAEQLGLTTREVEAYISAQNPEFFADILATVNMLGVEGAAADSAVIKLRDNLATMFPSWMENAGGASNFGQTLEDMQSPVLEFAESLDDLPEKVESLMEQLQDIGSADFTDELDNRKESIETFADLLDESGRDAANQWAENMLAMGQITQETFDSLVGHTEVGAEAWRALAEGATLSINDYINSLNAANDRLAQWEQDFILVGSRAGAGFTDVVQQYLIGLGDDAPEAARLMADATDEEFMLMVDAIKENAERTGPEAAVKLDGAMQIIAEAGRQGGRATADAIARELDVGVGAVSAIAIEYGRSLIGGINPVLLALGQAQIVIRGQGSGSIRAMAEGGRLPDEAMFQPARPRLVQWAEPETEGEWFIPRAKSKRRRSENILSQVAGDFGYRLQRFADGGFHSDEDIPAPPRFEEYGFPIEDSAAGATKHVYQAVIQWIQEHMAPDLGTSPGWKRMWLALKNAIPEAQLISSFRPGAITATGNRSYHGMGRAIDVSPMGKIANWVIANYMAATKEMIFSPFNNRQIHNGGFHMYTGITRANHWDHVHWAMREGGLLNPHVRDEGGPLMPGFTYNGTGRPEMVLPMSSGGYRGGGSGVGLAPVVQQRWIGDDVAYRPGSGTGLTAPPSWMPPPPPPTPAPLPYVTAAHENAQWRANMRGNLSGTTVGQHIMAANADDPEAAAADLDALLDLYVEVSDRLGQATADALVFSDTGLDGFQVLGDAALAAADRVDEAAEEARKAIEEKMAMEDIAFEFGDLGTDEYLAILNERLAGTVQYSEEWANIMRTIQGIQEQQAEEAAQAEQEAEERRQEQLERQMRHEDRMYQNGVTSRDAYREQLRERLEHLDRFSDEWWATLEQLNELNAEAWEEMNTTTQEFSDTLSNLTSRFLGAFDAATNFYGALQSLTDVVDENGATLDVLTEAGRANRQALSAAASAALSNATAVYESTGSISEATATLEHDILSIQETLISLGFTPTQAKEIISGLGLHDALYEATQLPGPNTTPPPTVEDEVEDQTDSDIKPGLMSTRTGNPNMKNLVGGPKSVGEALSEAMPADSTFWQGIVGTAVEMRADVSNVYQVKIDIGSVTPDTVHLIPGAAQRAARALNRMK